VTDLGLPSILWTVLWVGALLNAILLSLIQVRNLRIHLIMAGLIAVFVALLLYAIAGFDRPYSGPISVTPTYYQSLLDGLFQRVPAARAGGGCALPRAGHIPARAAPVAPGGAIVFRVTSTDSLPPARSR
jgi:hypothetical protein